MVHDKTKMRGDILVDDNAHIHGHYKPQWKHILVDQPHNQDSKLQRLFLDEVAQWETQLGEIMLVNA